MESGFVFYTSVFIFQDLRSSEVSLEENLSKLESLASQIRPVLNSTEQKTLNQTVAGLRAESASVKQTLDTQVDLLTTDIAKVKYACTNALGYSDN